MLSFLHIRNLATVSELEMEFSSGLNAITGETGTGKSVIMGALQALIGDRMEKSIIRHGENRCEIAAEFNIPDSAVNLVANLDQIVDAAGTAPCRDQHLRLRRVITPTSSRAYINDSPVTLESLKSIGRLLIDIHGPHDHQSLLAPSCQLDLLDAFAGLQSERQQCNDLFLRQTACRKRIEELRNITVDAAEQEILTHQLGEITAAELDPEEEKQLQEQYRTAANARTLIENANRCRQALTEADDGIVEMMRPCVAWLEEIASTGTADGAELLDRLTSIIAQTEDLGEDLMNFAETVELDGRALQEIEQRIERIQRLRRKYGGTVAAVLERAAILTERLQQAEQKEELLKETNRQLEELQLQHRQLCAGLSGRRRAAAKELAVAVEEKLQNLGFTNCRFIIEVETIAPAARGSDRVEFTFAPNPGEGILPLRKIVSSGEMARIMLGIKAVFSSVDQIPVLVFDEVDANIGGRTANQVAGEMARIARHHQIFCITHLPQIAAAAHIHYLVDKDIVTGRTATTMRRLDNHHRVNEIVRMMGGDDNSEIARKHARTMIQNGEK